MPRSKPKADSSKSGPQGSAHRRRSGVGGSVRATPVRSREPGRQLPARRSGNEFWPRERLTAHPDAQLVPSLGREEYRAFLHDVRTRGIQVPLDITAAGVVLDGHQRLRTATELELAPLPVRVVAPENERSYILRAALSRRHLTPSQKAALATKLVDLEGELAQARSRRLANLRNSPLDGATLPARAGRTRDLIADLSGASPRVAQDALTVKTHDPELLERVIAGEIAVNQAARRIRQAQVAAEVDPNPLMPEGPFELIYADPPWQMGNPEGAHAPENHYTTMQPDQIKAVRFPAAETSVLYLWAVNNLFPLALEVMEAWGYEYVGNLVWVKPSPGLGVWARQQHELLLIGRRGNQPPPEPERRHPSVINAHRGRHSEKPQLVYELLEHAYPNARKLELFARQHRPGWAAHGNQLPDPTERACSGE